ncbi:MAG: integrase [Solirubrobacteraceae bacterium]|nr:integrase [Solirubrobacteraceae bacterium]
MGRRPTGQVIEKQTREGRVFALRFRAYGQRHYLTLGGADEGWTRQKAEVELTNVLADVRRGIWRPPEPEPAPEPPRDPTFHEFASEWFDAKRRELRPSTVAAYEWEITHLLLPFFHRHRLSQITVEQVDRYRQSMVREREQGRRLSNETINKSLTRLAQILEVAVEYDLIARNPAAGKRRRLKVERPQRSYLDRSDQIASLLDAAGELDAEARSDYANLGRRATVATLLFAGLRIGELCALRWRDVDLAAGRLTVGQAKTDAGVREIDLLPGLRDELADHKARAQAAHPDGYVFATAAGGQQNPSNIRTRILAKAIERANERRAEQELTPLPDHLTPHSLRRTFASLLFALGRSAPEVMDQLGHTDPKLTLRIYARAMRRDPGENERLQALAGASFWAPMGTGAQTGDETPPAPDPPTNQNPRHSRGSTDGRGWARTSDLSRVKRALSH